MITLDDLEAFVNRGWKIFPVFGIRDGRCRCGKDCGSPGKHPLTRRGVKDASDDPTRIMRWFYYSPGCNWAVATGDPSGVWVLDIDMHGADGASSLRAWLDLNGVTIPATYVVASGGGGWHYYFDVQHAKVPTRGAVLPGVDVRSDGGYVVLPGSNHVSGNTYEVVRDVRVVHAPQRLTDYLKSAGRASIPSGGGGQTISTDLGKYLTNGFTPGNRDNECYRLACSLWRKHWDEPALVEAAIADCWRATSQEESPFPWSQAARKIAEARKFIERDIEAEAAFLRQHGGAA